MEPRAGRPARRALRKGKAAQGYRELEEATHAFDREMVVAQSRPLTPRERKVWEAARRKPGRPRRGAGVRVISVSVERRLLERSDALARRLGISRSALIERGLEAVLTGRSPGIGHRARRIQS